jgi:hypothetical protein
MRILTAIAALCLGLGVAAPAAAQTPEEQRQLDWAGQRGRLIFELDRAAWVTTDDMLARVRDPSAAGISGWTVERDGDGYKVIYFARGEGDAMSAVYQGRVENHHVVSRQVFPPGARPPLTALERRLALARGLVERMGRRPCTSGPFNTVAIPPDSPDGPLDLYALTAQTENGTYPFGGHFLAHVSAAGEILSQRAFTNGCLNMNVPPQRQERTEALAVTHLLDPLPTEIHVFLSLSAGLPVFVATNNPERVWEVDGDRIHLVDARH